MWMRGGEGTNEFGLVDHRREDEFRTAYTLVEVAAMELLGR